MLHNPYRKVLGLQIFIQLSHMSPLHGVIRPFCHTCQTIYGIQVTPDRIRDPARRLGGGGTLLQKGTQVLFEFLSEIPLFHEYLMKMLSENAKIKKSTMGIYF